MQVDGASSLDPDRFGQLPIVLPDGGLAPLHALAWLEVREVPGELAHEGGRRMVLVGANVRGRDVGTFVEDARALLSRELTLPEGYYLEWGGSTPSSERPWWDLWPSLESPP